MTEIVPETLAAVGLHQAVGRRVQTGNAVERAFVQKQDNVCREGNGQTVNMTLNYDDVHAISGRQQRAKRRETGGNTQRR